MRRGARDLPHGYPSSLPSQRARLQGQPQLLHHLPYRGPLLPVRRGPGARASSQLPPYGCLSFARCCAFNSSFALRTLLCCIKTPVDPWRRTSRIPGLAHKNANNNIHNDDTDFEKKDVRVERMLLYPTASTVWSVALVVLELVIVTFVVQF